MSELMERDRNGSKMFLTNSARPTKLKEDSDILRRVLIRSLAEGVDKKIDTSSDPTIRLIMLGLS